MPHFLCGSLAEEGTTLRINTPLKRIPLPKQPLFSKVATNEARPINSSMPALCWPDDHETNNSSGQKKRKGNPSEQAEAGEKGALHDIESRGDESRQNILRFPPKIVAMHKGSGGSLEDCFIHLLCLCCTVPGVKNIGDQQCPRWHLAWPRRHDMRRYERRRKQRVQRSPQSISYTYKESGVL